MTLDVYSPHPPSTARCLELVEGCQWSDTSWIATVSVMYGFPITEKRTPWVKCFLAGISVKDLKGSDTVFEEGCSSGEGLCFFGFLSHT